MRSMPPSPLKALGRRDLAEAEAAARDLERVGPEHALAIVLLMAHASELDIDVRHALTELCRPTESFGSLRHACCQAS